MGRLILLLFIACGPDRYHQCLSIIVSADASRVDFQAHEHELVPPLQPGFGIVEGVGDMDAYRCCTLAADGGSGAPNASTCGVDCTDLSVGDAGNSWDDVASCGVAVQRGKVVARWIEFD